MKEAGLCGRLVQKSILTNALGRVDTKQAVLLIGESGAGKTSLLRWAYSAVGDQRFIPAMVRAFERSSLPTYFSLRRIFEQLLLECESRGLVLPTCAHRLVGALREEPSAKGISLADTVETLEAVASYGTPLLIVDDVDFLHPDALSVLIRASGAVTTPLLLLGSARQGSAALVRHQLANVLSELNTEFIDIPNMNIDEVQELTNQHLGKPSLPSLSKALHTRTLGNPLFVIETLKSWQSQGCIEDLGTHFGISHDEQPRDARTLCDLLATRLESLSFAEIRTLKALAILERDATSEELAHMFDSERIEASIDALLAQGLISIEPGIPFRLSVAHPMLHTSVLDLTTYMEREHLHRRAFEMLLASQTAGEQQNLGEVAAHGIQCMEEPPELNSIIESAAQQAERSGDYREAAHWTGVLLRRQTSGSQRIPDLLYEQAMATLHFEPMAAIEMFTFGLKYCSKADRAKHLLGRAHARRCAGLLAAAADDLEAAKSDSSPDGGFEVRHYLAVLHAMRGDLRRAEEELHSLSIQVGELSHRVKSIGSLAQIRLCAGDVESARVLCEEALEIEDGGPFGASLRANLGWYSVLLGNWAEAETVLGRAATLARATGDAWNESALLSSLAKLESLRGNYPEALEHASRCWQVASMLGNPATIFDAVGSYCFVKHEVSALGDAFALLGRVPPVVTDELEPREMSFTQGTMGEIHLVLGNVRMARASLDLARHNLGVARFWEESVDRLEAQILLAEGNPAAALRVLDRWLAEPGPIIWEHARLLEITAQALVKTGKRQDAIARVDEAIAIYERLGAAGRLQRARDWRTQNYRRKPGRPRSALPGGVTERERDVLELVVLGKTNREIADALVLSVLTVNKHVENIIMKAGVSRRTELVAFAERLGLRHPVHV